MSVIDSVDHTGLSYSISKRTYVIKNLTTGLISREVNVFIKRVQRSGVFAVIEHNTVVITFIYHSQKTYNKNVAEHIIGKLI